MKPTGKPFLDEKYAAQTQQFAFFLLKEDLETIRPLYPQRFWENYEANIQGMAYFSCPIIYPDYFKDGDLIRIFIAADEYAEGEEYFQPVIWWFKQTRDGAFERLTPQTVQADHGGLICVCGNTPAQAGFYSCNEIGREVDPNPQDWKRNLYACDACGCIIDLVTLQVQGFRLPNYTYVQLGAAISTG